MSSLFGSQEILIILETLFLRTPNNHLYFSGQFEDNGSSTKPLFAKQRKKSAGQVDDLIQCRYLSSLR